MPIQYSTDTGGLTNSAGNLLRLIEQDLEDRPDSVTRSGVLDAPSYGGRMTSTPTDERVDRPGNACRS